MAAILALISSIAWGIADFMGGVTTRRFPVVLVVLTSQFVGLLLILPFVVISGHWRDPRDYVVWAVAAGLAGIAGMLTFYRALAIGAMGIVSPVASMGVLVLLAVAAVRGEQPVPAQVAGIAVTVVGVLLASGPELSGAGLRGQQGRTSVMLAAVAAVAFGATMAFMAEGSRTSVPMTMTVMRMCSVSVMGIVALVLWSRAGERPALGPDRWRLLASAAVIGFFDVTANLTYGMATTMGMLSVVAVLGSLYPVVTVLLAHVFLGERLMRIQQLGVVVTMVGVGLISSA